MIENKSSIYLSVFIADGCNFKMTHTYIVLWVDKDVFNMLTQQNYSIVLQIQIVK